MSSEIVRTLLDHYHIGAYIGFHEGASLGAFLLIFIVLYSLFYDNLCEYISKSFLGKGVAAIFILSFLAYFLNIDLTKFHAIYPVFLNILELKELLEIVLLGVALLISIYLIFVFGSFLIIFRFYIYYIIAMFAIGVFLSLTRIKIALDPNLLGAFVLIWTIYKSNDVTGKVKEVGSNLKRNLTCWIPRIFG